MKEHTIDYGLVGFHIEPDLINLESSGIEWLWSSISSGNAHTILIDLGDPKVELISHLKLNSRKLHK